jgi:hypothetical protein
MPAVWFAADNPPESRFPAPDPGQEKFNSRLVAPTIFPQKPIVVFDGGLFARESRMLSFQQAEFKRRPFP